MKLIKTNLIVLQFIFIVMALLILLGLVVGPALALPGRSTPATTDQTNDESDGDDDALVGGYIELRVSMSTATWSYIEWQDIDGRWHVVDGWAGTLESGHRRWWVAAKDFGTGPFRWVVSQSPQGPVIHISQPFFLPVEAYQTVVVKQ